MNSSLTPKAPRWQVLVLKASALHSAVWGLFIITMPALSARVYGFFRPLHDIHLWQGAGLFITLLAIGYGLAATNPRQHWGIVLIGLLAKVSGSIGMCGAVLQGQVSSQVLWLLPINDVIWWWPFAVIVRSGMSASRQQADHY